MGFFKTPESKFSSFQERAQFVFVWRITLGYTLISLIMSVFTLVTDQRFLGFYLAALAISFSGLYFLNRLKTYKEVAIIIYLSIAAIVSISVFTLPESLLLQESLWMVVIILTSFFTLGNRWGVFLFDYQHYNLFCLL